MLIKSRRPIGRLGIRRMLGVAAAALLAIPTAAAGQAPPPPRNDHYIDAIQINAPGTRLFGDVGDRQNTRGATVQTDLLSPPRAGGPPEDTRCEGASIGKTVWYDFYPDLVGLVRIRTNGYDTSIRVVPFNQADARPNAPEATCSNASSTNSEEFFGRVRRGASYSVQVGGVNGASGDLEMLFDFFPDADADGVIDDADRCPGLIGIESNDGCPDQVKASLAVRFVPAGSGLRLTEFGVRAAQAARVEVRCSRGCRRVSGRARRGVVNFRRLRGVTLREGSRVDVRVTQRRLFGSHFRLTVRDGRFERVERCMNPGSRVPRRSCG